MNATSRTAPKEYESLAGLWKLLCALAVLLGHNLVTMSAMAPTSQFLSTAFKCLQVFPPVHFFFFSGYLAASSLGASSRPSAGMMLSRAFRIYVLVLAALFLGVVFRWVFTAMFFQPGADAVWPLSAWDGEIDPRQAFLHLSPLGLVDTTRFNYATWYIYHELRLVALFPLFGWMLTRKSTSAKWLFTGILLALAVVLEYRLWSFFPHFRSSPFQTMSYGVFFLAGALVHQGIQQGGWIRSLDRRIIVIGLIAGMVVMALEPLGIRPPVDNPPILGIQPLVSQILVFSAIRILAGDFKLSRLVRKACDWSVGIYIVHPPIHVVCTWLAIRQHSFAPLFAGMAISILAGVGFHQWIEKPSLGLTRWFKAIGTTK